MCYNASPQGPGVGLLAKKIITFADVYSSEDLKALSAAQQISSRQRTVVCIQCYIDDARCDAGEPCHHCVNLGLRCRRAKCGNYRTGTCARQSCLRAHQEDENVYQHLVVGGHISKDRKTKKRRFKKCNDGHSDDDTPFTVNLRERRVKTSS